MEKRREISLTQQGLSASLGAALGVPPAREHSDHWRNVVNALSELKRRPRSGGPDEAAAAQPEWKPADSA